MIATRPVGAHSRANPSSVFSRRPRPGSRSSTRPRCPFSRGSPGTRVHASGGKISVVDGPFAEAKEVIGGYAIMRVSSKKEAIELTKKFLEVVGGSGTCELHELYEMPA